MKAIAFSRFVINLLFYNNVILGVFSIVPSLRSQINTLRYFDKYEKRTFKLDSISEYTWGSGNRSITTLIHYNSQILRLDGDTMIDYILNTGGNRADLYLPCQKLPGYSPIRAKPACRDSITVWINEFALINTVKKGDQLSYKTEIYSIGIDLVIVILALLIIGRLIYVVVLFIKE